MMRILSAGTALALILAGPLMAQQATDETTPTARSVPRLFLETDPAAIYASDLIGMDVYSSATDYATEYGNNRPATADVRSQWDDIGEINDVVVSPDGSVQGSSWISGAFSASAHAPSHST